MQAEHLQANVQGKEPLRRRILRHGHLVALALALFSVALHAIGWLFPLPMGTAEALRAVGAARDRLDHVLTSTRYPASAADADATARARVALEDAKPISPSAAPLERDPVRPACVLEARRAGQPNEVHFLAPKDLTLTADRGVIRLRWLEESAQNVATAHFVIERAIEGADFRERSRVPAGTFEFEDREIEAAVRYAYRVLAVTEDALLVQLGRARSGASLVAAIDAPADYEITLLGADAKGELARFSVRKWHEETWWVREFAVRVDEEIGALDTGTGVDFSTRRRLSRIVRAPEAVERTRVVPVFDALGRVVKDASGTVVTETYRQHGQAVRTTVVISGGGLPERSMDVLGDVVSGPSRTP